MLLYISGSFKERARFKRYADILEKMSYVTVTSSWLTEPPMEVTDPEVLAWHKRARANEDLEDVLRSDMVAVFTRWPSSTGGLHVELGAALAAKRMGWGGRIILIGPLVNVFAYLNVIERMDGLEQLAESLDSGAMIEYAAKLEDQQP